MTEKTESAATMADEALAATCGGIVRDYLAHRGYEVRVADGCPATARTRQPWRWTATRRC